jgi:hypothetical protein
MLHLLVGLFVGWIVLVNATWFLITGDFTFLKKTSFYVYNLVVLIFVIAAGFHDWARLKKVVWWSCVIALLAQVGWLELFPAAARRATGTFNNPNQLGYWALLLMACLAVVKDREGLGPADLLALGAGFYVTALSLSKAASISAMVLLLSPASPAASAGRRAFCSASRWRSFWASRSSQAARSTGSPRSIRSTRSSIACRTSASSAMIRCSHGGTPA